MIFNQHKKRIALKLLADTIELKFS